MTTKLNSIVVNRDGNVSNLTECLNHPPMKWINPRPMAGCCQVYTSTYGGGLVDGDVIRMRVECHESTKLYLGSQSSTKVYRSHRDLGCMLETSGTVHANSLAVICPDPVVPFEGSRYRQSQVWEVHPEADLILFDWLQPGRSARGEIFAYVHLLSELRVLRPGGLPLVVERFACEPSAADPATCGRFGPFTSMLNICLVGPRITGLVQSLEEPILALNRSGPGGVWVGIGARKHAGYLIRALGRERRDLQPLKNLLFTALAGEDWLGFNPWDRRW